MLEIAPNSADILASIGLPLAYMGEWDRAKALIDKAMKLNPNYPPWMHYVSFYDCLRQGDYAAALDQAQKSFMPGFFWSHISLATSYGHLGRDDEARAAVAHLTELSPNQTIESVAALHQKWNFHKDVIAKVVDGLRKAGLPETTKDGPD